MARLRTAIVEDAAASSVPLVWRRRWLRRFLAFEVRVEPAVPHRELDPRLPITHGQADEDLPALEGQLSDEGRLDDAERFLDGLQQAAR